MEERPLQEQVIHQEVIDILKKSIYNYPNATHPNLITYSNHPLKNKMITDIQGNEYYPDLVIFNSLTNKMVMIGEVETVGSVNIFELAQWQIYANLSPTFYLFYPKGNFAKMHDLCQTVPVAGFFEYQKDDSGRYTISRHYPF
jgi:hypothetical protein